MAKASKQLESMKSAAEMGAAQRAEAADLKTMVRKHEDTIKQLNKELLQVSSMATKPCFFSSFDDFAVCMSALCKVSQA